MFKQSNAAADEETVINPGRLGKEFAMGAAEGGVLGGGQMAVEKTLNGAFLPGSGLESS